MLNSSAPSAYASNISLHLSSSTDLSNFFTKTANSFLSIVPDSSISAISIHYLATSADFSSVTSPASVISPVIWAINLFFLSFNFFFCALVRVFFSFGASSAGASSSGAFSSGSAVASSAAILAASASASSLAAKAAASSASFYSLSASSAAACSASNLSYSAWAAAASASA